MKKTSVSEAPGCLMTLAAPMGSGKTYGIIHYISQQVVDNPDFRTFFVTNDKKGLHSKKFLDAVQEAYQDKNGHSASSHYLHQRVAVLKALPDTVTDLLEATLPSELETHHIKYLISVLKDYQKRYQDQPNELDNDNGNDWKNLKQAYEDVKQAIIDQVAFNLHLDLPLSQINRHKIQHYAISQKTPLAYFLEKHFPTLNLKTHQLIILTSAKLISTYLDFFTRRSLPVSQSQCLGNALVVIDEIDNLKTAALDKIIDDAQQFPVDFLPFFKEIFVGVNNPQKKRSANILKILRRNHKLSFLKHQVNFLAQVYELEEDYKTVGFHVTNNFIFTLSNLTGTSNGPWWSYQDKSAQQVKLYTAKAPKGDHLHFYRMLRQMGHFQLMLTQLINDWANQYQKEINQERQDLDNQLSLDDAILTICDCLGFSAESKHLVLSLHQRLGYLHGRPLAQAQDDKYGRYLQRTGLQLFSMTDSDAHLNRTALGAVFIQETPEKFLLKLAQRGMVLGMSATVDLETVLGNFDFGFLREQLGVHFIDGTKDLSLETRRQFDVTQRCRQQKTTVKILPVVSEFGDFEDGGCMRRLIHKRVPNANQLFQKDDTVQQLEDIVQQLMCDVQRGNSGDYYQNRYLNLFDSFICFLIQPKMPTFLGLQSVLPKAQDTPHEEQMSETTIQQVFELLTSILCSQEKETPQLRIIKKSKLPNKKTVETQISEALRLPEKMKTRVYLLSAYQTLGVGQNLVHTIGNLEVNWAINIAPQNADLKDPRQQRIDISGIYYGPITHIFADTNQVPLHQLTKSWILKYYQIYSLVDNHEISLLDVQKYIRNQNKHRHASQFRQTISYVGAQTRIILQAAGRLDRTFNKVPVTLVVISAEILNYFNVFPLSDDQLGPIAQALRDYQREKKLPTLTKKQMIINHWNKQTKLTQARVNWLKKHLQESIPAEQFKNYRKHLLCHPTESFEDYHSFEKMPEFTYLEGLSREYRVERKGESFTFLPENQGHEVVSAQSTGLTAMMQNPTLAAYFDKHHYPRKWAELPYSMNPVQVDSYKGYLGEVCGKVLMERYWHVVLKPLPQVFNEFFDFETTNKVLIDFKNWRQPHRRDVQQERRHVQDKLKEIRDADPNCNWRVLIVNILQPVDGQNYRIQPTNDGRILEVPYLLNQQGQSILTPSDRKKVADFLNE
ncbi:hypothetical protein [Levilactobacillus acidifarinae]|nr:hypothetical protein [Levilactobacillus acidifarinae]